MSEGVVRFRLTGGAWVSPGFCERNLNLLAHAQAAELEIGSRCGGFGECGGDRILIDAASRGHLSPPTAAEREHLGEDGVTQGLRLACQCFPEASNLDVLIELDMGGSS